jgi:uncharacterized protein (TIGR02001 family)
MLAPPLKGPLEPVLVRALWRTTRNRRRATECAVRHGIVALCLALVASNVSAQISGTASLVSNYRFRGISLSENKPAAQVGFTYDDVQGWYAGAFASTARFATSSAVGLQAVPFVGYAWRASGLTWDVGADYSAFTGTARRYNYPEVFLGAASENISARLYYSPRYFGQNLGAVYGEINGTQLLVDRVRLLAHIGLLRNNDENTYYGSREVVFDGRVGVGIDFDQFNLQVSWVGTSSPTAAYVITGVRNRNGPMLTISRSF